jgi:pimeloyl-ACP methyl ester carboxylesterase
VYTETKLHFYDDQGVLIPNTFYRQSQGSQRLAILFPGYTYNALMPVLYYPARLILQLGIDLLSVDYQYSQQEDFPTLTAVDQSRRLSHDARAACDAALEQGSYAQVILIGKSVGTLAMGHLLATDARLKSSRCVWLTPLLHDERLRGQIKLARPPSLFVTGDHDRHYQPAYLAELVEATGGKSLVVPGADHSLDVDGDALASVEALERMLQALQDFLA